MSTLDNSHKWSFPSNNYGQIFGIADSGVETFKGTPFKSLAREICQNSIDAKLQNSRPTYIQFKLFEISPSDIPDCDGLKDAFARSLNFWSEQKSDKAKTFFKKAINAIQKNAIPCLRISDYNTTGLTGSDKEYNSPWCNLTKSTGASDKSGTNGGSFGIGKFAPFACSAFRTVFYSTNDIEGVEASQGVSRLTSFKNAYGEITQGIGFYGDAKNEPLFQQFTLDPMFSRRQSEHGTDIYIVGFNGGDDWQHQMVASILDGFLFAVNNGSLIVDVDGTLIRKDTLGDLVKTHKDYFQEHADEYYRTITDDKTARTFELELTDDPETAGKLTLQLMIMPEFHRRVAMVRQTGMKIKDKGNINGLIPFAGMLYIEGDALNTYLRSLENPQHLEWEIERSDNKNKAKKLLNSFTRFIKTCLDEMKNDDSEEAIDPSVGEYLSAMPEEDHSSQNTAENIEDSISDIKIRFTEVKPKPSGTGNGDEGQALTDDENGDTEVSDVPGEGGSGNGEAGGGGGDGGGHAPGDGGGDIPAEHKKTLSSVSASNVRSLVRDKDNGLYTLIFTPKSTATAGILEVFMSAESQNYDAAILYASCDSCPDMEVHKNKLTNVVFTAGQPLKINIQLDYRDFCSMEVKAYGNKI